MDRDSDTVTPRQREPLLGVRVPEAFAGAVERAAAARGVSKSALVRQAVVEHLLPPLPEEER